MKNNTQQMIDDDNGIMIRVDKTLHDLNSEKPISRWDVNYWNPRYTALFLEIKCPTQLLGNFINSITYGAIVVKKKRFYSNTGIKYLTSKSIREIGIDFTQNPLYIPEKDIRNKLTKKPKLHDILFNRSGVGTLGRQTVFTGNRNEFAVSDDINIISIKHISSYYISLILKTRYGIFQIERNLHGVSGQTKISFGEIRSIKIPILSTQIQKQVEQNYLLICNIHKKAMEAKKNNDNQTYENNIKKAEEMLRDLIARTESVIRGEREDVV